MNDEKGERMQAKGKMKNEEGDRSQKSEVRIQRMKPAVTNQRLAGADRTAKQPPWGASGLGKPAVTDAKQWPGKQFKCEATAGQEN